ncbi:hypothetical protein BRARA_B02973 [Brassica rapa]|uniref:Uncharacterized protein n=1 Tax=Brassica campestris TaxID=3711 RepID=A0A398AH37_BRACM|nr:hypothetical protein BRARA_B02973 [Brassica rapa]
METVVLLGDAGTEVMGRQGQDLMDYYLEEKKALKKGGIFRGHGEHLEDGKNKESYQSI